MNKDWLYKISEIIHDTDIKGLDEKTKILFNLDLTGLADEIDANLYSIPDQQGRLAYLRTVAEELDNTERIKILEIWAAAPPHNKDAVFLNFLTELSITEVDVFTLIYNHCKKFDINSLDVSNKITDVGETMQNSHSRSYGIHNTWFTYSTGGSEKKSITCYSKLDLFHSLVELEFFKLMQRYEIRFNALGADWFEKEKYCTQQILMRDHAEPENFYYYWLDELSIEAVTALGINAFYYQYFVKKDKDEIAFYDGTLGNYYDFITLDYNIKNDSTSHKGKIFAFVFSLYLNILSGKEVVAINSRVDVGKTKQGKNQTPKPSYKRHPEGLEWLHIPPQINDSVYPRLQYQYIAIPDFGAVPVPQHINEGIVDFNPVFSDTQWQCYAKGFFEGYNADLTPFIDTPEARKEIITREANKQVSTFMQKRGYEAGKIFFDETNIYETGIHEGRRYKAWEIIFQIPDQFVQTATPQTDLKTEPEKMQNNQNIKTPEIIKRDGKFYIQLLDREVEITQEKIEQSIKGLKALETYAKAWLEKYGHKHWTGNDIPDDADTLLEIDMFYKNIETSVLKFLDEDKYSEKAFNNAYFIIDMSANVIRGEINPYSKRADYREYELKHLDNIKDKVLIIQNTYKPTTTEQRIEFPSKKRGRKPSPKPSEDLKLKDLFADASQYENVMALLVEHGFCESETYIYNENSRHTKKRLAALILFHLFKHGYYKDFNKPSFDEVKIIAKNTFKCKVEKETIKRAEYHQKDFSFITKAVHRF